MVDIAFALVGEGLPREHRRALAAALDSALPSLAGLSELGVHGLNLSTGDGPQALLSRRTRLTLRVPRRHAVAVMALAGARLQVGPGVLSVGAPQQRELLPHGTLYAHLVAADGADEVVFMATVEAELGALGVRCRPICGTQWR